VPKIRVLPDDSARATPGGRRTSSRRRGCGRRRRTPHAPGDRQAGRAGAVGAGVGKKRLVVGVDCERDRDRDSPHEPEKSENGTSSRVDAQPVDLDAAEVGTNWREETPSLRAPCGPDQR